MAEVLEFPGAQPPQVQPACAKQEKRERRSKRVSLEKARLDLAYEAAGQIDVMVCLLLQEIEAAEREAWQSDVIHATLVNRIKDLNGVVLSVIGYDDGVEAAEMYEVVHHRRPRTQ